MPTPNIPTGVNHPNPPPLPGVGVPQPTPAERAAVEARFAALRDITPDQAVQLAKDWLAAHPEFREWLKASLGV